MPEKSSVDVQKLCDTAEKTDGSVAFGLPLVLSQLEEWSDVGFFPPCWHPSSVLALTEDKQKCWFCSRSEVLRRQFHPDQEPSSASTSSRHLQAVGESDSFQF